MDFARKKVLVLGLGISGCSACRYLLQLGASVEAYDEKRDVLKNISEVKDLMETGLKLTDNMECKDIDFLVPSPGVPKSHPIYKRAIKEGIKIIGEAELAFCNMNSKVVGITGTNGKTTVTELTAYILNDNGKKAAALGNNGKALTDWLISAEPNKTIVVAELSSYQLETLATPILDAAIILNLSPDHLDRYGSMNEYAKAKLQIQKLLKPSAPLFIHPELLNQYPLLIDPKAKSYITDKRAITFEIENKMAAYHLTKHLGIKTEEFEKSIRTFTKPLHRLEFVRNLNGVSYYNDSKGTNIDSVIKAVEALKKPIILIAGGKDKGISFESWIEHFNHKVLEICAIGEAKDKLYQELSTHIPTKKFDNLCQAFRYSFSIAKQGDSVLLSPGCSSFDQYDNFEERGNEFRKLVLNLNG